jgi:hypothetical protein
VSRCHVSNANDEHDTVEMEELRHYGWRRKAFINPARHDRRKPPTSRLNWEAARHSLASKTS